MAAAPPAANPATTPKPCWPRLRAAYDATYRLSAVLLTRACTTPTRRSRVPFIEPHSASPVSPVGTAARVPKPMSLCDAGLLARPPTRSSTWADVQRPNGRSVSSGCTAWPSHMPRSTSAFRRSASTARANGSRSRPTLSSRLLSSTVRVAVTIGVSTCVIAPPQSGSGQGDPVPARYESHPISRRWQADEVPQACPLVEEVALVTVTWPRKNFSEPL